MSLTLAALGWEKIDTKHWGQSKFPGIKTSLAIQVCKCFLATWKIKDFVDYTHT